MTSIARSSRRARFAALFASAATLALLALTTAVPAAAAAAPPASFGSEGSGAGQFIEPLGIAVDQETGDVYIADRNNRRIDEFDQAGAFIRAFGWGVADGSTPALQTCTATCFAGLPGAGAGQLNGDEGIAVDNSGGASQGDVYVARPLQPPRPEIRPGGEFLLMLGGEVDKTSGANLCAKADLEGGDECGIGLAGTAPGRFQSLFGRSLAVDSTGRVFVGDENRVQRFSPAGVLEAQIALPGVGSIENLAVDSAGDLYVKGSELAGVRKYNPTGTELGSPRDEAGEGERQAIAIGAADELFLNDFQAASHHLLSYDAAGAHTATFDPGSFAEDGQRGIAYSEAAKAIYVLNEARVRDRRGPAPGALRRPRQRAGERSQSDHRDPRRDPQPRGSRGHPLPLPVRRPGILRTQRRRLRQPQHRRNHARRTERRRIRRPAPQRPDLRPQPGNHLPLPPPRHQRLPDHVRRRRHLHLAASGRDRFRLGLRSQRHRRPPPSHPEPPGPAQRIPLRIRHHPRLRQLRPRSRRSSRPAQSDLALANPVQGLLPATTYHYRVLAHNELGTSSSADRTFHDPGRRLLPAARRPRLGNGLPARTSTAPRSNR